MNKFAYQSTEAKIVVDYWYEYYVKNGLCSLCGNSGKIDTRSAKSAAGVACGDMHYCICPNGMIMRDIKAVINATA